MSGAIAGTAILKNLKESEEIEIITITINNDCNMCCPHCYMQYDNRSYIIGDDTLRSIYESSFKHLAVVGREPLINDASIDVLGKIIDKCIYYNKSISVVTNGSGLMRCNSNLIKGFEFIDVSFDGGVYEYNKYRKGRFSDIINGVKRVNDSGVSVNALHVLTNQSLCYVDDMLSIERCAEFKSIMFSPYLMTRNDGKNIVDGVGFDEMIKVLAESDAFMTSDKPFLLIDVYHAMQWGKTFDEIHKKIDKYNLGSKVKVIERDPVYYGVLRVTYDDYLMTPEMSLHTRDYKEISDRASKTLLNEYYSDRINKCVII